MKISMVIVLFIVYFNINQAKNFDKNGYYKSNNKIYYKNKEIKNVDFDTFEILDLDYSKDINHVYLKGKKFKGADPKTFEVLKCPVKSMIKMYDTYYAKDKNNLYYMNKIVKGYEPQCGIGFLYEKIF